MYPLEFSRMSLATAIIGSDGIVLASDSMEVEGREAYQSHNAHKIERIADSVWIACVGNAPDYTNHLISNFKRHIPKVLNREERFDVSSISDCFGLYANDQYTQFRQHPGKTYPTQPQEVGIEVIFVGYTNDRPPEPRITVSRFYDQPLIYFSAPPPFLPGDVPFYAGGVPEIARYWMHKIDRVRELDTIDSQGLRALTILILIETIKAHSTYVGAPLDIVTIKPDTQAEHISISEIEFKEIQAKIDATVTGEQMVLDKLVKLTSQIGKP